MHRSRPTISSTPGGMTKMEIRNIFGPEATSVDYPGSISVSVELTGIVSTIP